MITTIAAMDDEKELRTVMMDLMMEFMDAIVTVSQELPLGLVVLEVLLQLPTLALRSSVLLLKTSLHQSQETSYAIITDLESTLPQYSLPG